MSFSVYILRSKKTGTYYIGSSGDPVRRTVEHNNGKTISTRNKGPWKLVFTQEYRDKVTARKIEYNLKRMKSKIILDKIIKDRFIKLKKNGD